MYRIKLTEQELKDLGWLTNRGYFPEEIYDNMYQLDEPDGEFDVWEFEEHHAWTLLDLRENDPDAYLACMGGRLLDEILKLEDEII